ncbi:G-type lectin S-receptor-like serine/threonine-protein kinase SD1-13 [Lolium rigidum]|uniref:G-type lectin S-receptor-like serine/threonine-protein kinase SD1-13 n=1 Tax=Lolium rigidum TaxID=89674 RepID=UPI001F5DC954|nr:G-type lectin S-receptor-like serine/threonine-protein kinase SD1-13 [Lolium rigidum]
MEDVLERIFHGSIEPRDVKLSALESITENFSEERIIGAGGFGTVYKGVLKNGEVAVKRLRNNQTIDEKLFRREVNSLLNVNHKNIVKFLGFCSNTEHKAIKCEGSKEYIYAEDRERILCFEYINNGSLDKYIADELRGLQWDTRYFIIKGICEGLQYLHMKKRILHMDLKPANILIDHNMVAKITDFGLSKIMDNSQTKSTTRFLSLGYTAPEYLENGKMSVKSDVYSLGIIIIELVTGFRSVPDINNRSPYFDDDMLGIEPVELHFPFELNNHISCLLELTNETNDFIAFTIQTTSPLPYCIQPKKDTVAPRSKYSVNITLQPLEKAPQDWQYIGDFIVRSTKVNDSLMSESITEEIFHKEEEEKTIGDYVFSIDRSILPPRSTQCLAVRRCEKEGAVENMEFNDEFKVGYAIVAEDIKTSDLDVNDYTLWKKLHMVGKKPAAGYTIVFALSLGPSPQSLPIDLEKPQLA